MILVLSTSIPAHLCEDLGLFLDAANHTFDRRLEFNQRHDLLAVTCRNQRRLCHMRVRGRQLELV